MSFLAAHVGMPSKALSRVLKAAMDLPLPMGALAPLRLATGRTGRLRLCRSRGPQVVW
jgi:hypothetical protein